MGTIAGYIATAFDGGAWDGEGLSSSAAQASAGQPHPTALGYATAASINASVFDGQNVSGATVLVRYTLSGDANLDGRVNALDFNALASNFGAASNRVWTQADFNYDGMTNSLDFNAIAINFNQVLSTPALASLVPEPAVIIAAPFVALLRRRRIRRWSR